jgi:hypothetical protein
MPKKEPRTKKRIPGGPGCDLVGDFCGCHGVLALQQSFCNRVSFFFLYFYFPFSDLPIDLESVARTIRLREDSEHRHSRTLDQVLAMPLSLARIAGVAWAWTAYRVQTIFKKHGGEISLQVDDSP